MPLMPPLVSTSSTRILRLSPKAWPLSHGVSGHGTRSMEVRMAAIVMSDINVSSSESFCCFAAEFRTDRGTARVLRQSSCGKCRSCQTQQNRATSYLEPDPAPETRLATTINVSAYSDALVVLGTAGILVPIVSRFGISPVLAYLGAGAL